jgi:hypothetical protein
LSLFLSVEVQKEFPDWSAIVDETEVRVPRPSNYQKQKEYWSKKTSTFSLSIMLVCTAEGMCANGSDRIHYFQREHIFNKGILQK